MDCMSRRDYPDLGVSSKIGQNICLFLAVLYLDKKSNVLFIKHNKILIIKE